MGHLAERARLTGARLAAAIVLIVAAASLAFAAPAAAQDDQTVTVVMGELNDSGVSGAATLEADGDLTVVTIDLEGATGDHPAHVHEGTCEELDPNPAYPLTDVNEDGESETSIDVPLAELLDSPHAVNVHRSTEDIGTYVSCGNITGDEDAGAGDEEDESAEETSVEESVDEGEAEESGDNADVDDADAADGDEVSIEMVELNDSGVSGSAVLSNDDGQTRVVLNLEGATGDHPAHIHEGTCDTLDPNPAYPLTDVDEDGASDTTVDIGLSTLTGDDSYAVNIHRSTEDIGTYVTCGDIVARAGGPRPSGEDAAASDDDDAEADDDDSGDRAAGSDAGDDDAGGDDADDRAVGGAQADRGTSGGQATGGTTGTTKAPTTGVGSGLTSSGASLMLVVGIGALAAALATGGLVLRRREIRQPASGRRR